MPLEQLAQGLPLEELAEFEEALVKDVSLEADNMDQSGNSAPPSEALGLE